MLAALWAYSTNVMYVSCCYIGLPFLGLTASGSCFVDEFISRRVGWLRSVCLPNSHLFRFIMAVKIGFFWFQCMHGPKCKVGTVCTVGRRVQQMNILGGLILPVWGTVEKALSKQVGSYPLLCLLRESVSLHLYSSLKISVPRVTKQMFVVVK